MPLERDPTMSQFSNSLLLHIIKKRMEGFGTPAFEVEFTANAYNYLLQLLTASKKVALKDMANKLNDYPGLDDELLAKCLMKLTEYSLFELLENQLIALVGRLSQNPTRSDLVVMMAVWAPVCLKSSSQERVVRFLARVCKETKKFGTFYLFFCNLVCLKGCQAGPLVLNTFRWLSKELLRSGSILSRSLCYYCNFIVQKFQLEVPDQLKNWLAACPALNGITKSP
ncbi:uncharacterized protein LOC135944150 [Cloeon dipterum]|uniref:uncharacterized protein LOC135944150 n=1 Tax=Cloeon dipterum TaxID=197152 RepID=UPI00321FC688